MPLIKISIKCEILFVFQSYLLDVNLILCVIYLLNFNNLCENKFELQALSHKLEISMFMRCKHRCIRAKVSISLALFFL